MARGRKPVSAIDQRKPRATLRVSDAEFEKLCAAAELTHSLGLGVNAGHGLTYLNLPRMTTLPHLHEVNIGHNIVARAVLVGLERAVKEMLHILELAG